MREVSRNPFQGGMGFFTRGGHLQILSVVVRSQSLSGWDGVFHVFDEQVADYLAEKSQSLSGWDGVFHESAGGVTMLRDSCRNPFLGGMGFFTRTM